MMGASNKDIRRLLRAMPECDILKLLEIMKISGLEKDIAVKYWIEHNTIDNICDSVKISLGTCHKHKNKVLEKIKLYLIKEE